MVTAPVAIASLGAITFIAIVAACVAAWRARAALRAGNQTHGESVELPGHWRRTAGWPATSRTTSTIC